MKNLISKTEKSLQMYYEELLKIDFNIRKVEGLVKRANNDGHNIYYDYHEDSSEFRCRWSSDDYKKEHSDVKLFERTRLIQKYKRSYRAFTKRQSYTAECVIFVFCTEAEARTLKI